MNESEEIENFIDQQRKDYFSRFPMGSEEFIDAWANRFSNHLNIVDRDIYNPPVDRRILVKAWRESGPGTAPTAPAQNIPSFREAG